MTDITTATADDTAHADLTDPAPTPVVEAASGAEPAPVAGMQNAAELLGPVETEAEPQHSDKPGAGEDEAQAGIDAAEAAYHASDAIEAAEPNGFLELGLSEEIVRAVEAKGYRTPTPIQAQAIPAVFMGRDVLGCAQTGTGKTASFVLPLMDILSGSRARARMPRSLILEPTRELALQVAENFVQYGKNLKLNYALLIGGESLSDQKEALMRGVDVLIATPGRLMDLFERGGLLLTDTKILVIDEADRMLDMGFIPDVERIVGFLPKTRQTLFFSATMAPEIRRLADAFLTNPKEITVSRPASVASTIVAGLTVVDDLDKREALRRLIGSQDVQNALIFCNRKKDVDILYKSLKRHGFSVGSLHGDMSQPERFAMLSRFKANEVRLLVCSDVAARGLDIGGLSHVFNFDVPIHAEDYVHRIGRTGRAGMTGHAFTLATPDDRPFVDAIERLVGAPIPRMQVEGLPEVEFPEDDGTRRRGRGRGSKVAAKKPARAVKAAEPAEAADAPKAAKPRRSRAKKADVAPIEAPQPDAAIADVNVEAAVADAALGETAGDNGAATVFAAPRRAGAVRPVVKTDEEPAPRRGGRNEGRRRDKRPEARVEAAPEPVPEVRPEPRAQPRPETRRREEPRREETRRDEPRRDEARRDEPRSFDRGRPRDMRRRDEDLGPSVVGFGGEVPAFMLLRPRTSRAAPATEE